MMEWSPDERDRRVIQPQIVHGVLEDLRPQLLEYGIRVSDSDDAEFNFENAGAWIRTLAVWLSMAAESCGGQKTEVARLAYSLIVVRFLHDIPGIQSVIVKSSLALLFETAKRECAVSSQELPSQGLV